MMAGYAGHFVAGYYLMRMKRPVAKRWLIAIIGGDIVVITLGNWAETAGAGAHSEVFKTYTQVFTVVMSCALFLLFKEALRERALGRIPADRLIPRPAQSRG